MEIYDYTTSGGKNLIMEYIEKLPDALKAEILDTRQLIREKGTEAFAFLITRQLYKKIWEIKISQERIMYVIQDQEAVYFLNICKKQKGKAEKNELEKAKNARKQLVCYESEVGVMPFVKADLDREKAELDRLINESEEARKVHEEFQARIALQQKLIEIRKAEKMTQSDVANVTGLSQQAVSRIEKGTGATISSLIKYLMGIGYSIELKKNG